MVCEKRKGKPHARARSPRLAWPGRAGPGRGVAWRGMARRGEAARTCDMRVNGPPKSDEALLAGAQLPFAVLFLCLGRQVFDFLSVKYTN